MPNGMRHSSSPLILVQKDDVKSRGWQQAAERLRIGELLPMQGSPMWMPFVMVKDLVRGKRPRAIVFRYLNDYPSYLRTVVRTFTDLLTMGIAELAGVGILWLCHNVDRETVIHHPVLTRIRRGALRLMAKKILVTDELLVQPAVRSLGVPPERVMPVCFGRSNIVPCSQSSGSEVVIERLREWKQDCRRREGSLVTGLWIGTPAEKKLRGLRALTKLRNDPSDGAPSLVFIVIGPIGTWLKKKDLQAYEMLRKHPQIYLIDKRIPVPPERWGEICDFVWKPCDDWSVNLTCYHAARAGLPVVGFKDTFQAKFIEHYGLGIAVNPECLDASYIIQQLQTWDSTFAAHFLAEKTWARGAKAMFRAAAAV